ncbi:MAG: prefoldin subunit alpha [Methanobacteriota archaeon]|nr:MAG: prefoldin subunit alpha [Euryarchaeota archaeon]
MTTEELQRAVAEYERQRAELEALARQDELLSLSLEEYMRAKETMTRYQKGGKGAEILVPIGANSFLFAEIKDSDKAVVGIGSDLNVVEKMDDAITRLEGRIEDLTNAQKGVADRMVELSEKVRENSELVRELYEKVQGQSE